MKSSRVTWGFVWIIIASILWGFSYLPQELVWFNDPIAELYATGGTKLIESSIVVAAVQSLMFTLVLFFLWSCINGKPKEVKRNFCHWRVSKWFMVSAVFGGLMAMFGSTLAVAFVGADYASAIALTCAVVGAIYGKFLFKEKLTPKTIAGIIIITIGGILVLDPVNLVDTLSHPTKDGVAIGYIGGILSAIGWGIESCYNVRGLDVADTEATTPVRYGWECILWFVVVMPICGLIVGFDEFFGILADVITNPNIVAMLAMVAMTLGIADSLIHKSLPLLGVGRALSINALYVPVSLIVLWAFLKDYTISIWLIIGVVVAVAGTFVMYWERGDITDSLRDQGE